MKRMMMFLALLALVGCGSTPTPKVVKETVLVEVTRLVLKKGTRAIEVTKLVEKPVTVLVMEEPLPTHTPYPTYTPAPVKIATKIVEKVITRIITPTPRPTPTLPTPASGIFWERTGSGMIKTEPIKIARSPIIIHWKAGRGNIIIDLVPLGEEFGGLIGNDIGPIEGESYWYGKPGEYYLDIDGASPGDGGWRIWMEYP